MNGKKYLRALYCIDEVLFTEDEYVSMEHLLASSEALRKVVLRRISPEAGGERLFCKLATHAMFHRQGLWTTCALVQETAQTMRFIACGASKRCTLDRVDSPRLGAIIAFGRAIDASVERWPEMLKGRS